MIVKIQQSQFPRGKVLVYTKNRRRWWEGKMDPQVEEWMAGKQKAFAYAHIEGTQIVIDSEAPWQDW